MLLRILYCRAGEPLEFRACGLWAGPLCSRSREPAEQLSPRTGKDAGKYPEKVPNERPVNNKDKHMQGTHTHKHQHYDLNNDQVRAPMINVSSESSIANLLGRPRPIHSTKNL